MEAKQPLQESVLFELAPPLKINGKRNVSAYLSDLLREPKFINPRNVQQSRALLLCAINAQLCSRVLADIREDESPLRPVRWRRKLKRRPDRVQPHLFTWALPASTSVQPLPETRDFIASLPMSVILSMLEWAPPVIAPATRGGRYQVVANHIPAMLAFQRLVGSPVKVHQLAQSTTLQRSFTEICAAIVHAMGPLFRSNQHRIAAAAGRLPDSPWFSGYCRSWSAELTSRANR